MFVVDVSAFDCSDRFYPTQGRFGRSQRSKTLPEAEKPLDGSVIAIDQSIAPYVVDVPDTVKMRIVAKVDLSYDTPIRLRFVSNDCDRSVQQHTFNRIV